MAHLGSSIAAASAAGVIAILALPATWLAPLCEVVAVVTVILAVAIRVDTKTVPPDNHLSGALLSIANLPEEPFAEVKKSWALTAFLASAAFLVSAALAVLVLANA